MLWFIPHPHVFLLPDPPTRENNRMIRSTPCSSKDYDQLKTKPTLRAPWWLESKKWTQWRQLQDERLTQDSSLGEEEPVQNYWLLYLPWHQEQAWCRTRDKTLDPTSVSRCSTPKGNSGPLLHLQSPSNMTVVGPVCSHICVSNYPSPKEQTQVKDDNSKKVVMKE